jgi:flagellar hook-associated protein 2
MSTTTATSSASNSSAPISFQGINSGLNTSEIITELTQADQIPITRDQNQQTVLQSQEGIYSQLSSYISQFQTDAESLNNPSTFNTVTASSSNTAAATITTTSGALPGTYNLTVNQLAQAEKIVSGAQTDTTSALNLSGTIEINGKSLAIGTGESLTAITQAINGLNAGVTAGLVDGGSGNAYLSLTSSQTGTANAIQLSDMSGNVLQSLGFTNGTTSVANPITNGAASYGFSSQSSDLSSIIGSSSSGTIQINGTSIAVNFATDSLQAISANINAADAGVTASVKSVTNNGTTRYQLQIVGSNGSTPTCTDSNNVLQSLGVLQQGVSNELVSAQDAKFTLDNASITSSSNTVTTAIPGATLTLLEGTKANPATTTIALTQSTSGITSALQNFVTDYNQVADFISSESTINTSTYATGPLFGDPTANQISNALTSTLFANVPGITGTYNNLASLGLTLNQSGDLSLNTDVLNQALASNPTQVQQLFQATGSSSNPNISYVSSTSSTLASSSSGYAVNISQLATKAQYVAPTAQTTAATNSEILTFGGNLLSNQDYQVVLNVGATLQDTVNQINADSKLRSLLTASINSNGQLEIDSKVYGTPGNFTIQSNQPASNDDSGVGSSSQTPTTAGLDVAGTINGEAATGSGQTLTGSSTDANAAGLSIQYLGSTTGAVGSINFSQGLAANLTTLLKGFTDPTSGLIATATNGLQTQYTDLSTEITQLQATMTSDTTNLQNEFNAMETAIGQIQQEGKDLNALLGTTSSSSSSSSSGSSSSSSGSSGTSSTTGA